MNIGKVLKIAFRDFSVNIRRPSFLFAAIISPLISLIGTIVVIALVDRVQGDLSAFKRIGVVDQANLFANDTPRELFVLLDSVDQARAGLAETGENQLDGYYVIGANYLVTGDIQAIKRRENPMTDAVDDALLEDIQLVLSKRLGDDNIAARIADPIVEPSIYRIGDPTELGSNALILGFFTPFIAVFLIFMATITGAQLLLSGLIEEKENRMMELFITSARPSEILAGKVIGLGGLGLLQVAIWFGLAGAVALSRGSNITQGLASLQLTPTLLGITAAYFLLSFVLVGVLMAGLGATASVEKEGQQFTGLLMIFLIIPFFAITVFLTDPNGLVARVLSYFPLTAPMSMLMRYSYGGVPLTEVYIGLAIMLVTIVIVAILSVRLFRLSLLNYGKGMTWRQIFSALSRGDQVATATPVDTRKEVTA